MTTMAVILSAVALPRALPIVPKVESNFEVKLSITSLVFLSPGSAICCKNSISKQTDRHVFAAVEVRTNSSPERFEDSAPP